MKGYLALILAVVAGVVFTVGVLSKQATETIPSTKEWNVYRGQLAAYKVDIDEDTSGSYWRRLVHLEPVGGYDEPSPTPFAITGHDYDGDGKFDRVFMRRSSRDGYSSAWLEPAGLRWDPCPADKDSGVEPFTETEVASAQSQLYLAMAQTHDLNHRVRHWLAGDPVK